jgi:hypothetical protein
MRSSKRTKRTKIKEKIKETMIKNIMIRITPVSIGKTRDIMRIQEDSGRIRTNTDRSKRNQLTKIKSQSRKFSM